MPAANIKINGLAASDDDLPIGVLVALDNQNVGGETAFFWEILDQPPGAVDALSSAVIQNPTFTPKKEGSYLLKLTVNGTLTDQKIAAVRQVKNPALRVPAAGETVEADASDGWATAVDGVLRLVDAMRADPGLGVGVAAVGGLARGDVLRAVGSFTLKPGLPGAENVPTFDKAPATTAANLDELLCVLEGGVDGNPNPAASAPILVRTKGKFGPIAAGLAVLGDPVFVSDGALLQPLTPGTVKRLVGVVSRLSGGTVDVWFDGALFNYDPEFGSATIGSATITEIIMPGVGTHGITRSGGNLRVRALGLFSLLLGTDATDWLKIDPFGALIYDGPSVNKTTAGALIIGTIPAEPVQFFTLGTLRWEITSAGVLAAVGGNRLISNVLDPVAAQDAATKNYVDGFVQSVENVELIPIPEGRVSGNSTRAAQTVFDGASFVIRRRTDFNRLVFNVSVQAGAPTGRFLIYQSASPGGGSGVASLKATIATFAIGGTGTFTATPSEGTVTLMPGLIYLLWGRDSGAGSFTCRTYTTLGIELMTSVVEANTHPTNFTTAISAATSPATFDPREAGDANAATTDLALICRLRKV